MSALYGITALGQARARAVQTGQLQVAQTLERPILEMRGACIASVARVRHALAAVARELSGSPSEPGGGDE